MSSRTPSLLAGRREIAFFLSFVAVVVGLSFVSVRDLQRSQGETRRMFIELARGLSMVADLQYQAQETRRTILYALTTTNSDLQVEYADQSSAFDKPLKNLILGQLAAATNPSEIEVLQRLSDNLDTYLKCRNKVTVAILEGDTKAALEHDMNECVDAFSQVKGDLDDVKLFFDSQVRRVVRESDRLFERSLWRLGFVLAIALGFAAIVGRSLRTQRMLMLVQRSETRLREVIGSISEGMFVIGPDGRFELWNRTAISITGMDPASVLHRTFAEVFPHWVGHPLELALSTAGTQRPPFELGDVSWGAGRAGLVLEFRVFPFDNGITVFFSDVSAERQAEREMAELNHQLIESSRYCGMAEIATGVLHNVGNVLNSVNVSANLLARQSEQSKVASLVRVGDLLKKHSADLADFLTADPTGKKLPTLIGLISDELVGEQKARREELICLQQNIEHVKQIVALQQSYAKVSGSRESVRIEELVEHSLRMCSASLERHQIEVAREFTILPVVSLERHKVLQILVNLIGNAQEAMSQMEHQRRLIVRLTSADGSRVRIEVVDNGVGIQPENLLRIFQYGFTTKRTGHGFGLHSAANAAKEMGGSLSVSSPGPGLGSSFALELPLLGRSEDPEPGPLNILSSSTKSAAA